MNGEKTQHQLLLSEVNPRWETCVFYYYYSTLLARKTYRENENSNRASKLNCKNVSLSSCFFFMQFLKKPVKKKVHLLTFNLLEATFYAAFCILIL